MLRVLNGGGELHVCMTMVKMLKMREIEDEYVVCHCYDAKWSLFSNKCVSSFIGVKFASKNCVWKVSRYFFGKGLNILGVGSDGGGGEVGLQAIRLVGWWRNHQLDCFVCSYVHLALRDSYMLGCIQVHDFLWRFSIGILQFVVVLYFWSFCLLIKTIPWLKSLLSIYMCGQGECLFGPLRWFVG